MFNFPPGQRGTLHADPLIGCPEVDQFDNDSIDLPSAAESTTTLDTAAYQACRDRLTAKGFDLASYNTTENDADIAFTHRVGDRQLECH